MLYSFDSCKYVTKMPHRQEFDRWMKNLNPDDCQAIEKELLDKLCSEDVRTSSWIPGNNWTGTVYEPIYHACGNNKVNSGLFFGLILFNVLMNYYDITWGFKRGEKNGDPIKGTTYFVLHNPPKRH